MTDRIAELDRRLERIRFFAAVDRIISEELVCPLCAEKRREYRALPPSKCPPALGPCYIHAFERRALYAGVR